MCLTHVDDSSLSNANMLQVCLIFKLLVLGRFLNQINLQILVLEPVWMARLQVGFVFFFPIPATV